MASRALLLAVALGLAGCSGGPAKFPLKDAMWVDPDRHPFEDKPEEYYSPFAWDGADQAKGE